MKHELQIMKEHFQAIKTGAKTAELRLETISVKYHIGDILILKEWDTIRSIYTGEQTHRQVSFITRPSGSIPGVSPYWVILHMGEIRVTAENRDEFDPQMKLYPHPIGV